ncbi:Fanconi anemia group F protein [Scomber japonicus]|uniref:Fanconi anemia group F protein n=1 Tax=Scomber japonicus TaxID=13676 RepID=UPI00230624C7|nr:Fanconi anemia group F protein [Scomber japonicus]
MEAVLRNLSSSVELLAVAALSGEVQQWDEQTVSRAFHWARYCEHIFSRFHNNPAISRILEKQLQITNNSVRAVFPGYREVCFSDLSRCQHVLLVGLLNNPEVPISIMKMLFDTTSPVNIKQGEYEDVTGLCSHIIQYKSACKVLTPFTDSSAAGADAEAEVQAGMLMERLDALLSQASKACQAERFLDSVLQGCEGASEHFCRVIAAALLTRTNSAAQTASVDFLLDWLQQKHTLLQHMCSALSSALLIDLAKECLKFRHAYCDVLKKWASDMEYSINDDEWVKTSPNPTVSFQKLTEHFVGLFEACPSLRNDVEKELNDLKISDGDFDVRGLSVWGDLLSEINKRLSIRIT